MFVDYLWLYQSWSLSWFHSISLAIDKIHFDIMNTYHWYHQQQDMKHQQGCRHRWQSYIFVLMRVKKDKQLSIYLLIDQVVMVEYNFYKHLKVINMLRNWVRYHQHIHHYCSCIEQLSKVEFLDQQHKHHFEGWILSNIVNIVLLLSHIVSIWVLVEHKHCW